jgi:hypothetical protein
MRKVRIKGTDIYVECLGIGSSPTGHIGIECKYLNGEYKNATEVIPGDCLVEENN